MKEEKQQPCRFEDNIIEMYGDIKSIKTSIDWLTEDSKQRNGKFEAHIREGDVYRSRVDKNTSAVFFVKWVVGFLMVMIGVILKVHLTK